MKYMPRGSLSSPGDTNLKIFARRGATELIWASDSLAFVLIGEQVVEADRWLASGCAKNAPEAQHVLQQIW